MIEIARFFIYYCSYKEVVKNYKILEKKYKEINS